MTLAEEEQEFYAEIGKAITQWANLEVALFGVVDAVYSSMLAYRLAPGFFSIENFRAKLAFADAIIRTTRRLETKSKATLLKDWMEVHGRMQKAAAARNKLAHHRVMEFRSAQGGKRFALADWDFSGKSVEGPPTGAAYLRDIIGTRLSIEATVVALKNLKCRVARRAEEHAKASEVPASPPTIREIEDAIRARHGRQPRLPRK